VGFYARRKAHPGPQRDGKWTALLHCSIELIFVLFSLPLAWGTPRPVIGKRRTAGVDPVPARLPESVRHG
jgi:hypothetical protein